MKIRNLTFITVVAVVLAAFTSIEKDTLKVDISKSTLTWKGYHLAKSYEHNGNVKLKSGSIDVVNGKITGGSFTIDMTSITNNDLEGGKNIKLVNHLKSDEFFAVEKYPEAKLVINKVVNNKASADITIRGTTEPIEFDFKVDNTSPDQIIATALITIDRIKHEVSYGWTVENAMLSNEIDIDVKLVASK